MGDRSGVGGERDRTGGSEDHDGDPPWGSFPPGRLPGFFMGMSRAVPPWPVVKQLAYPLRRLARRQLEGPVDARLWGHRLRFHPTGNVSEGRLLFMPELWDRSERAILREHARPGTVFVDVGANFGAYTWWLLHLLGPDCAILALEPDPEMMARLRFNVRENGWDNVTLLACAAGDREGTAILRIDGRNRGENRLDGESSDQPGEEVAVRPLHALVRESGLSRIDILKIDIEGLEPRVLGAFFREADPSLWPKLLLTEWQGGPEYGELDRQLREAGYRDLKRTRLNRILTR